VSGTVNVAELKNHLSAYLRKVQAGQEFVVRDRNLPIARLVPIDTSELSADELLLASEGKLRLPTAKLNLEEFFAIGKDAPVSAEKVEALVRAISEERGEREDSLLGR
jgi:prevent-host-death family protein